MLSNNQKSVLKYLYPTKTINENDFEIKFKAYPKDKIFSKLFSEKYLHRDTSKLYAPAVISLTEAGSAYVEELKTERRRIIHDWINTAIALIALVVAIVK
jgi:hypothetical protein